MRELLRTTWSRLRNRFRTPGDSSRPEPGGPEPETLVMAGEIAEESGRPAEALTFYGRAVDVYLEAGFTDRAEALCVRMIEMQPRVIRTRYTLAAISVARGNVKEVRRRLADYMAAVILANAERIAVPSLLELAGSSANSKIRLLLAEALRRAGRADLGDGVEFGEAAPASRSSSERALGAALTPPETWTRA